jgi:hypothetical protein
MSPSGAAVEPVVCAGTTDENVKLFAVACGMMLSQPQRVVAVIEDAADKAGVSKVQDPTS